MTLDKWHANTKNAPSLNKKANACNWAIKKIIKSKSNITKYHCIHMQTHFSLEYIECKFLEIISHGKWPEKLHRVALCGSSQYIEYIDSHYRNKTVWRPSHLYNGPRKYSIYIETGHWLFLMYGWDELRQHGVNGNHIEQVLKRASRSKIKTAIIHKLKRRIIITR